MDEEIKKYKIYFTKHLQNKKDYTSKLNKYYNIILSYIYKNYKHISNVMNSSLVFYIFLVDKNKINIYSSSDINKIFYLKNILNNSLCNDQYDTSEEDVYCSEHNSNNNYDIVSLNTNVNLLNYHPLILSNLDKKEKLIKMIVNKLMLAIKIDLFRQNKSNIFIDYYEMIKNSLKTQVNTKQTSEIKRKTHRGGFKKKIKNFKKKLFKKNLL